MDSYNLGDKHRDIMLCTKEQGNKKRHYSKDTLPILKKKGKAKLHIFRIAIF
jgi:hypothetical protein